MSHMNRFSAIPNTTGWVRDERNGLLVIALFWSLLSYMIVPPGLLNPNEVDVAELMTKPNPLGRFIKLGLMGIGFIIIVWRASLSWLLLRHINLFFLCFLCLVPASMLWSIDPGATIARFISILSVVLVCFACGVVSWRSKRLQEIVRPIVTLLLLSSILLGLISLEYVIENDPGSPTLIGAWHGITSQKNQFGQLAGFGLIFWLNAWLGKESKPLYVIFGGGIALTCLILSRSATSILAAAFSMIFMLFLLRSPQNLKRYMPLLVITFAAVVLTYALAVLKLVPGLDMLLTPITAITGKDMTFSNRSEIWVIIKEHVLLSPLIGSGYGAYWVGPVPSSPSFDFLSRMYFYPTQSHNGYLEVVNDLGYIGFACLIGYLVTYVSQSLRIMKIDRNLGALYLCLFFHQTIVNLSESCWFQISTFSFIIMTIATIAMARTLLEARLQSAFAAPSPPPPLRHQHIPLRKSFLSKRR